MWRRSKISLKLSVESLKNQAVNQQLMEQQFELMRKDLADSQGTIQSQQAIISEHEIRMVRYIEFSSRTWRERICTVMADGATFKVT